MRITADEIAIGSGIAAALPPISFTFAHDESTTVPVDTAERPTVLALAVTGRMRVDAGRVLVDGRLQPAALRRSSAIVDAPTVAEPSDAVSTRHVVHEELVISGQPNGRSDIERLLARAGALDYADAPLGAVPGALRTRLLAESAASRPEVRALVLTSPERHGGDPVELAALIEELSERGFAVLTLTSAVVARALS